LDETKAPTVWITGLPSSGKTTLARAVIARLQGMGCKTWLLDGEEIRNILSRDLGFSKEDRRIQARRVTYLCSILAENGIIPVAAIISPYREFRGEARSRLRPFVEVYTKCSLKTCRGRDTKGLFRMAEKGLIKNVTGIDDPYEEPLEPELVVDTERESPDEGAKRVVDKLIELALLPKPRTPGERATRPSG